MFETEEKRPGFSAQFSEPDNTPDNEAAEWAIVDQLAQGTVIPTGQPIPAEDLAEIDFSMADVLGPAIQTTADVFAPNWQITEDESQSLGSAWGAVIEVWFPGATLDPKWAALGLAVITTGAVLKSRAGVPLRKPKIEKREEKEVNANE